MYIRIVTFGITVPEDAYVETATGAAEAFAAWPGLIAKWWLRDPVTGTYGGVYLFESREAAEESRGTAEFAALVDNPVFSGITLREYDVLEAPTNITAPVLARRG